MNESTPPQPASPSVRDVVRRGEAALEQLRAASSVEDLSALAALERDIQETAEGASMDPPSADVMRARLELLEGRGRAFLAGVSVIAGLVQMRRLASSDLEADVLRFFAPFVEAFVHQVVELEDALRARGA